jgi:hypothetical protein
MSTTTLALIRDRASDLIAALTPVYLAGDLFIESRHEYKGDIRAWGRANAAGCLRRFSVREFTEGGSLPPTSSNVNDEQILRTLEYVVCYPQTHRFGEQAALDRDDVIDSDYLAIEKAIGLYSRANFPSGSAYDCCWAESEGKTIERDDGVDFLVTRITYRFFQRRS